MDNEKVIRKENKQTVGAAVRMSELLYLCFWGIMLFAKGIGLYDGQNIYKLFLVTAFLCIAVKMCITEYTYKEWRMILCLLVLSTIVYQVSGEKGVLICMVTVTGMKNVSVKRAFQVGLVVWSVAMGGRFFVSLMHIEDIFTEVQIKNITGAVLRYFMGYPHPNTLHISYLVLTAFLIYCVKETYGLKHLLMLVIGNLFVFFYSYSFTGALIVMIYICLSYYVSKRTISKTEYFLVNLFFPFCILFSIIFPLILKGRAYELADKIFNNRINYARHFLTVDNMSFLGNNLASLTTNILTMDNAFIFALVTYGIPIFLLICVAYVMVISQSVKEKKNIELVMICCFLAAGITEPFLFNTSFKNLTLLFIGELFFRVLCKNELGQKRIAVLRNKDRYITLPKVKWNKISEELHQLWTVHSRMILGVSCITAVIISISVGLCYQHRPEILEIELSREHMDNLLKFERIRVVVTAFVMGFTAAVIVISATLKAADKYKHKTKSERINFREE